MAQIKFSGFELDEEGQILYRVVRDHAAGEDRAVLAGPQQTETPTSKHRQPTAQQLEEWMVLCGRIARSLRYRLEWVTHLDEQDLAQQAYADALDKYRAGQWDYLVQVAGTLAEWEPLQERDRQARRGEGTALSPAEAERYDRLDHALRAWMLSLRRELGHWLESQQPPRIKPSDLRQAAKQAREQYLGDSLEEHPQRARRHTERKPRPTGRVTTRYLEGREPLTL